MAEHSDSATERMAYARQVQAAKRAAEKARTADTILDDAPPVLVHAGEGVPVTAPPSSPPTGHSAPAIPDLNGTDDPVPALPAYERFESIGQQPLSPAELDAVTLFCAQHCQPSSATEPRSPLQVRWDTATTNVEKRLLAASVVRDLQQHRILEYLEKQYAFAAAAPNNGGQEAAQVLRNLQWAQQFIATYG